MLVMVGVGVEPVTVKPSSAMALSDPVVKATFRLPRAAVGSMLTTAVALVVLLIVSDTSDIPAPKLA